MNANNVEIGKKVMYYPILGGSEKKPAVIESDVYNICGTQCCKINIMGAVVAIENLEEI